MEEHDVSRTEEKNTELEDIKNIEDDDDEEHKNSYFWELVKPERVRFPCFF